MTHQLAKRALAYVEAMPSAVSGNGGHDATFAVARVLIHGFGLPESDAWPILCAYNERCLPPWSERELRHKLADASSLTRAAKQKGHLAWSDRRPPTGPSIAGAAIVWDTTPKPHPQRTPRTEQIAAPPTANVADSKTNVARPLQEFDGEARRISYELLKLHRDGAIKEPADASFYANLIHTFGATYTKANSSIEQSPTELTLTC